MGGDVGAWTLFDLVNDGYLEADNYNLIVSAIQQSTWTITVNADGTVTVADGSNGHYMAFFDSDGFYCSDSPQNLCLFAQCELVSGQLATLEVVDNASMYVVPSGSTLTVGDLSTVNVT